MEFPNQREGPVCNVVNAFSSVQISGQRRGKGLSKCFLFFKKKTNGKALTVISEAMHALNLGIYSFIQLGKYTLYIYLTLMCDL